MTIAGFTFVRNSVLYDYPIQESIQSILPICDVFYVLVGNGSDGTLEQIQNIKSPKIKIITSVWDETIINGGAILASETDKCMAAIKEKYDWLFYLQADEVVHEKYLPIIKKQMLLYKDDAKTDGLLFQYTHFFGSYEYVADSRKWYRKEIRIIKQDKSIKSYRDAQGFRKNNKKLYVREIDAHIYHYGYIRNPESMFLKISEMSKYYNKEAEYKKNLDAFTKKYQNNFDYSDVESLKEFKQSQPLVMQDRIKNTSWRIKLNAKHKKFKSIKNYLLFYIEKITGYRFFEYKNYKIIFLVFCFLTPHILAFAQCSLCTKTAMQLGPKAASGMNAGVLYMMAVVAIIIIYLIYRLKKSKTI